MTLSVHITQRPSSASVGPVLVSVIIPLALHEPDPEALIAQLPDTFEVLLARGGTRASSMNAAAAIATGENLWFVHADTRLKDHTLAALLRQLATGKPKLFFFDIEFDGGALMRFTELGVWFRSRLLGIPFGDQAFCLPAARFQALGGYDEAARYGEDHLLVCKAREAGLPLHAVGARIVTSSRKYQRHGWFKTTATHLWLTLRMVLLKRG